MKGAIIGDIVGSVYEWHNIKTKDFVLFAPHMGRHRNHECFFTDDTVMTVAVGEALRYCRDWSDEAEAVAFLAETMRRYGAAYPGRGYGGAFKEWLAIPELGAYNSWGNGAPMRASAAGWLAKSEEDALRLGRLSALPTHDHPEGIKGAQCVAHLIYLARRGDSMEALREVATSYYDPPVLDDIRPTYTFDVSTMGTMPVALSAFFESTDFEDAIRNAVSVGGDTDTIAAITGSIAEAFYGVPHPLWRKAQARMDNYLRGQVREFYKEIPKL